MATGLRLIVVAVWLLMFGLGSAQGIEPGCLKCHPVHYGDNGSCTDCHRGRPDTYRKEIAHHRLIAARFAAFTLGSGPVVEQGVQLMQVAACRRCHVSGGKGNALAADLDRSLRNSSPEELSRAIENPALFMPDFRFSAPQLTALINAVLSEGSKVPPSSGEVPLIIHFEGPEQQDNFVFQKECGACHRALTKQRGGLGGGEIGANLSGLLSEYYPRNYREEQAWTVKALKDWLTNPRAVVANARMQPVTLKERDWLSLQRELLDEKAADSAN